MGNKERNVLKIVNADPVVILALKRMALDRGTTFRQQVLVALENHAGGKHGVSGDESGGAGGGEAGEVKRKGNRASVSDVRKAEGDEVGLHPVQSVRGELAGGVGSGQEAGLLPCGRHPGKNYVRSGVRGCSGCDREARGD